MTTLNAARPAIIREGKPDWAFPDPPKRFDAMQQMPHIIYACYILEDHFADRPDALVGSNGYLCYDRRDRSNWVVPDCVVALGVDPDAVMDRNGYEIRSVGKPPDFVLEVASKRTGRRDYIQKREIYAEYGVREYWRFDRTGGEYHNAPLAYDLLVDGEYRSMPLSAPRPGVIEGVSAALDIGLRWDDGELALFDPRTGEALSPYTDVRQERDAEAARADAAATRAVSETIRANAESARANAEAARADAESARTNAAEAELRRLRELLP